MGDKALLAARHRARGATDPREVRGCRHGCGDAAARKIRRRCAGLADRTHAVAQRDDTRCALHPARRRESQRRGHGAHLADGISDGGRFLTRRAAVHTEDATVQRLADAARSMWLLLVGATAALPITITGALPAALASWRSARAPARAALARHTRGYGCGEHSRVGHGISYRRHSAPSPGARCRRLVIRRRCSMRSAARFRGPGSGGCRMTQLRITGGTVHDPANGIDGDVRDICIDNGRIVAVAARRMRPRSTRAAWSSCPAASTSTPTSPAAASTLGAASAARRARRRSRTARRTRSTDGTIPRSGTGGTVPSTFTTGYRYAGLGYTTVFDAAVAPLTARRSHAEFDDTPIVDGGFFMLMGNDEYLLRQIAADESGRATRLRGVAARSPPAATRSRSSIPAGSSCGSSNVREREDARHPDRRGQRDAARDPRNAGRRRQRARPAAPAHIHCNNLGVAGNVATTLDSMRALEGRRAHFTHLQFHSYGGERGKALALRRARADRRVRERASRGDGDVGQVMFGAATTLTADGAVEYLLHTSSGRSGSTSTSSSKPGAASCRTPTRRRPRSPRCSGSSASSSSCSPRIRGAWCSPPIIRTAARS